MLRCNKNIAMHKKPRYMMVIPERQSCREPYSNLEGLQMSKTKTTAETIETVEFPTFDASKATDQLRTFAEKGVEQSKEAYAKLKTNAEETQKAFEASYKSARAASDELSLKTIAALRANAEANFAHLEALVAARSLSEFIELQTSFLRKRVELGVAQAKDFQAVATKAAEEVTRPLKSAVEKTFQELKAA